MRLFIRPGNGIVSSNATLTIRKRSNFECCNSKTCSTWNLLFEINGPNIKARCAQTHADDRF
jgi:hypothetical protein